MDNIMNEEKYLEERIEDQINYYEKNCVVNKNIFIGLAISQLLLCVSIPFLSIINEYIANYEIIVGIIGVLITVIVGILSIMKN